ncbi:MAG TPA: response regulator [Anaerolineae bacterium]|nr:response regulator [Anaerolineae bacterium]
METQTQKASILIVDDTPANLRLLMQILSQAGHRVRVIPNGKLALQSVATTPPDLILLDIMMPELDGYEVCAQLKADPASAAIPIIFITALNEPLDKVKAFNLGGVDYITKPFQTEEVLARVRTHLHIHELQIQLETANTQLTARNAELQARNAELQEALNAIHTLSGLIPICAWCGNKIQNEEGQWVKVDTYIESHSEATFTHGICPDCLRKLKSS